MGTVCSGKAGEGGRREEERHEHGGSAAPSLEEASGGGSGNVRRAVREVFRCEAGTAWTVINLVHFAATYRFFHWKKGTPFAEDQGDYGKLTWWEQVDDGRQLTRNRKFLTVVPVVLYLIASHTTDYRNPNLFLNTIAVCWLVIAKFPNMHRVRIFGINSDYDT
nr:ORM1-like protein 3 [Physcomitrium patens]|eukprot:XP_024381166.1 ORM1-like protein 3 [Physcomitrella patens]